MALPRNISEFYSSSYRCHFLSSTFFVSIRFQKNPPQHQSLEKSITTGTISKKGLKAYSDGLKLDAESKHQEAVDSFTRAIKYGYSNIEVFLRKGCSLQLLHQHELAIRDFGRVIAHRPDDCYPLFMRSVSKYRLDDVAGAILDIKKAILLSLAENETNDEYCEIAMRLGWGTHTALYEVYLNNYRKSMD